MFKRSFFLVLTMGFALGAAAESEFRVKAEKQLSTLVPGARIIKQKGDEFDVVTSKETVMEIEFHRDGTLDEASGKAAFGGDTLNPGEGLLSLAEAVAALRKSGKTPTGEWSLERSWINGWTYEFEGVEEDREMEYVINAKDGKLIRSKRDF